MWLPQSSLWGAVTPQTGCLLVSLQSTLLGFMSLWGSNTALLQPRVSIPFSSPVPGHLSLDHGCHLGFRNPRHLVSLIITIPMLPVAAAWPGCARSQGAPGAAWVLLAAPAR